MTFDTSALTNDVRRNWEAVLSHRRNILLCVTAALVAATAYNHSYHPIYEGRSVVSVREMNLGTFQPPPDKVQTQEIVESQIAEIRRPEFLRLVVSTLSPEDRADIALGPLSSLRDKLHAEWVRRSGDVSISGEAEAVDALNARLELSWKEPSTWITISVRALDPDAAARMVNAVVNQFIISTDRRNQERAARMSGELEGHVAEMRGELDRQLSSHRSIVNEKPTGDIDARRQELQQQASGFLQALVAAETTRAGRAATRRDAARSDATISIARSDPQMLAASNHVAELEERERSLLASLGERHPEVASVREQLASARARVKALTESFQKAAEADYRMALAEETRLRQQLEAIRSQLQALDADSVDYSLSKKKAEVARASLDVLIQRGQLAVNSYMEARVIQAATPVRQPIDPESGRTYLIALAIGLTIGLGITFWGDQFRDTVRFADDLRRLPSLRVLGALPLVRGRFSIRSPDLLAGGFGDSLRVVRTNLAFFKAQGQAARTVVITSPSPQDGKSTTAAALSLLMREISARVLLVDADLRRPSGHELFGLRALPGLSEVLAGRCDWTAATRQISPGFDMITAGHPQELSSALLGSEAMISLLAQVRGKYDWVIIDSPPALALPDASIITTLSDGAVIVCSSDRSRLREIHSVREQIEAIGGTVLGAVLNRADRARHDYYYGRSYNAYYDASRTNRQEAQD